MHRRFVATTVAIALAAAACGVGGDDTVVADPLVAPADDRPVEVAGAPGTTATTTTTTVTTTPAVTTTTTIAATSSTTLEPPTVEVTLDTGELDALVDELDDLLDSLTDAMNAQEEGVFGP